MIHVLVLVDGRGPSEGSWSALGSVALHYDEHKPTMLLDLGGMSSKEIDATIVHQFGHALGLGHALISKQDWSALEECVNVNAIKKSFSLPLEKDFELQWTGEGAVAANYDKDSVMLYKLVFSSDCVQEHQQFFVHVIGTSEVL